jgi:hypothetical protein
MGVKFTYHSYHDTHKIYARVEGADPVKRHGAKRLMAAQHVQVRYVRRGSEDWKPDMVSVSGGLLKADGTPGAQVVAERFYRHDQSSWPDWLRTLVEESTPETLASVARDPLGSVG